jgi:hypothetical protein
MANPPTQVNVSIPADLAAHLRAAAAENDRTISAEARRAFERYFAWGERAEQLEEAAA